MELFFNECSLHGQFSDIPAFSLALDKLMHIRQVAKKYNLELYCHRNNQRAQITHHHLLLQAIQHLEKSKAQAFMGWFGRSGPYWDDDRRHANDEYYECLSEVVTDTAIGECAFLRFSEKPAQLIS